MIIEIYSIEDVKKSGGFKKKNNVLRISKEDFFKYLKENDLNIQSEYIDSRGTISNDKRFRCFSDNFMIGVSSIVKEFKELK